MLDFLKRRLPDNREIVLALSMAAFLVFTWSLRSFFYNVPAFLLSYSLGEILAIAAYMLAFALLETTIIMLVMLALAVVLPGPLLRNGFSYKTAFLLLALGAVSIHLQFIMTNQPKINFLLFELGRGLAVWLAAVLLTRYVAAIQKIVMDVLDRLTIFIYIYIPLGLLSLVVVLIRLVW